MKIREYWTLPNDSTEYSRLPKKRCGTKPYPIKWSDLTEDEAKEQGAIKHKKDILPQFYSVPQGENPWTISTDADGVRIHTLALDKCDYDQTGADSAHSATIRAERDARILSMRDRVERHQRELRLDRTPTEDGYALDYYIQQLCDLPEQDGFPWDGDIDAAPWPEAPAEPETAEA